MTTVSNDDWTAWNISCTCWSGFNLIKDIESITDVPKNAMSSIKVGSSYETKEELGSIGIGASICHGKDSSFSMHSFVQSLICEFVTIDTLSSSTISNREVTSLCHESRNDSMECASLVMKIFTTFSSSFFSSAEGSEIFSSYWVLCSIKSDCNSASCLTSDCNVKVHCCHLQFYFT